MKNQEKHQACFKQGKERKRQTQGCGDENSDGKDFILDLFCLSTAPCPT